MLRRTDRLSPQQQGKSLKFKGDDENAIRASPIHLEPDSGYARSAPSDDAATRMMGTVPSALRNARSCDGKRSFNQWPHEWTRERCHTAGAKAYKQRKTCWTSRVLFIREAPLTHTYR